MYQVLESTSCGTIPISSKTAASTNRPSGISAEVSRTPSLSNCLGSSKSVAVGMLTRQTFSAAAPLLRARRSWLGWFFFGHIFFKVQAQGARGHLQSFFHKVRFFWCQRPQQFQVDSVFVAFLADLIRCHRRVSFRFSECNSKTGDLAKFISASLPSGQRTHPDGGRAFRQV